MKNFNYKEKALGKMIAAILSGSSAIAMMAPAMAAEEATELNKEEQIVNLAQTEDKAQKDGEEDQIEVIEVSGMRFSQLSALNRKKNGGTMMDSLVAEDIGQFPDKNVAEALQRIPGVQLNRDFGEGNSVSIRGVEPDLLKVEVNNVSALGFGGSRGVDFRDMASELIKALDVIKGSEAHLTEGGIGGTIHVETRKPNEFEDNFLQVSYEGQYNDLIGNVSPKMNFTGVYKFTEDFGVLVNATGSDKSTMIHALRNTEWNRWADYDGTEEKTSVHPDYASITDQAECLSAEDPVECEKQWYDYSPVTPRYGIWGRDEKRLSANITFQYQLTEDLSTHIGYTHNTRDKRAQDLNLDIGVGSALRVDPDSVIVDELHNVKYFKTSKGAGLSNRTLNFAWEQETSLLDAGFVYAKDAWRVKGVISKSTSEQDIDSRDTHATTSGLAGIGITLDKDGKPEWDYSEGYFFNADDEDDTSDKININDPTAYRDRVRFKYAPSADQAEERMAKLDVSYIPESDFFTLFQTGYRMSSIKVENANWQHNIIRDVGGTYGDDDIEWTREDNFAVVSGRTFLSPKLFDGYDVGVNHLDQYWAINTEPFIDIMESIAAENVNRADLQIRAGHFDQVVNTEAVYAQANFETELAEMRVWGNLGVRYVETEIGANGDVRERIYVDNTDVFGNIRQNEFGIDVAGIEDEDHPDTYNGRKTVVEGYSDTLPSINLNFGLIPDELVLYVGAAKVLAHPKTGDLNVNANCRVWLTRAAEVEGEPRNSCTAGNPALDPYMANQWEVAVNWYPDEQSIISGSYFVKDITSWIIGAETREDVDFFGDGRLWDVRQKINGSGVTTKGLELQGSTIFDFLPAPFNNFGGSVNYTYMQSEDVGLFNELTGEELPFPSMSENSYNISAFYEDDHWSARIAYNYRDEYLARARDRSGNPVFVDDAGYMDAKLIYTFDNGLKVFIDGRNLLSEVKSENAGPGRLSDLQWSGREYSIGFSYKM